MSQDNPCLAYRFIHNTDGGKVFSDAGWTAVVHRDDLQASAIELRYFPIIDEIITISIYGDEINVRHDLLTQLNRGIPIPPNFNNPKLALMLEHIWLFSTAIATELVATPPPEA